VPYFIKIRNIGILPYIERPAHEPLTHDGTKDQLICEHEENQTKHLASNHD
jgi:hypothetical protein